MMQHRLLTTPHFFEKEAVILAELFANGLPCLHIRKPKSKPEAIKQLLKAIPKEYHHKIVLHQHHTLVKEFGLKGVHLTESGRRGLIIGETLKVFRKIFEECELGTAIHNPEDLENLPSYFDYVFVSPVFDSVSKVGYAANAAWAFNHWNHLPFEVIGLGGMGLDTIVEAKARDFKSIALLGAVWADPQKTIENYNKICQKINGLKS